MGFVAPMIVGYIIDDNNDVQHWQVGPCHQCHHQ